MLIDRANNIFKKGFKALLTTLGGPLDNNELMDMIANSA